MSRRDARERAVSWTVVSVVVAVALVGAGLLGGTAAAVDRTAQENGTELEIVATYPTEDGQQRETLLTGSDFESVGQVDETESGLYSVPVTLTNESAGSFADRLRETGFTDAGVNGCRYPDTPDQPGYCLLTILDGDVVFAASMSPELAEVLRNEEFQQNRRLQLLTSNESDAQSVRGAIFEAQEERGGTGESGGDGSPLPFGVQSSSVLIGLGALLAVLLGFAAVVLYRQ